MASIGGWWGGRRLTEIDEADWQTAFVELATAHVAVLRAFLPRLDTRGAYCVIVGSSAVTPVPSSGLISMEQAALLMMQQVATAELAATRRVFALVLGGVRTRHVESGGSDWVSSDDVGAVAVAASSAAARAGREIRLGGAADVERALALFGVGVAAVVRS